MSVLEQPSPWTIPLRQPNLSMAAKKTWGPVQWEWLRAGMALTSEESLVLS